ncbi:MAG TPA: DUF2167 domain-containing protein [Chthoniobacterales bacterium]|jgi:uncharacterized membrane-anchored protein
MRKFVALFLIPMFGFAGFAQAQPKSRADVKTLIATLKFQQGQIGLRNGLATVNVPAGFRYLDGTDAKKVLVDLWGNPPGAEPLGLLMPDMSLMSRDAWAVIITYAEDGYVKDHDAEKINYDELLKQMQQAIHNSNPQRTKQGYPTMELVGWAAPPRYDHAMHKLYWAKELKFGNANENTLNYNIRMLGRHGVLVLNAVASMSQLPDIEKATPQILAAIDYNPGNRYADFDSKAGDKVATYGLAALVAGGVAAKLGLFKGLWVAVLAAKKFIIIAALAVAAWFRRLFGNKRSATS